jgi:phenylacetate-CoA ligase
MVIPVGGGATDRQARLIVDLRPEVLMATPSYALVIADAIERAGADPAGCGLRLAICGAEPWSEALRAEIEARFGVDAFDSYGLSEVIGPGVAQERAGDKGALTIWEDHFWPEIVDPATGGVVADGEPGEAVFTTLTKQGMPLIRYRSRDVTHLLPPAGGPMRRMARVRGRSDDMLIVRGVNVYPTQIEAVLAHEPALAPHYLVELRRGPGRLDQALVRVESRGAADDAALAALSRKAERLIKSHLGVSVAVAAVPPGTLGRSEGKATRVVDLRPKE